jgi:hypothetical protein
MANNMKTTINAPLHVGQANCEDFSRSGAPVRAFFDMEGASAIREQNAPPAPLSINPLI